MSLSCLVFEISGGGGYPPPLVGAKLARTPVGARVNRSVNCPLVCPPRVEASAPVCIGKEGGLIYGSHCVQSASACDRSLYAGAVSSEPNVTFRVNGKSLNFDIVRLSNVVLVHSSVWKLSLK